MILILLRFPGTFTLEVIDWAAGPQDKPLLSEAIPFTMDSLDSKKLLARNVSTILSSINNYPAERVFVRLVATAAPATTNATTPSLPATAPAPVSSTRLF